MNEAEYEMIRAEKPKLKKFSFQDVLVLKGEYLAKIKAGAGREMARKELGILKNRDLIAVIAEFPDVKIHHDVQMKHYKNRLCFYYRYDATGTAHFTRQK